jgi:hypothetical protein
MDTRRHTVDKLIAHSVKHQHGISGGQIILAAAQETGLVTNFQANRISEEYQLGMKWDEELDEIPKPDWTWQDQVPWTDWQTSDLARQGFREERYFGALEAVRKDRGWSLKQSKDWVDRVFPTMRQSI